MAAGPGGAPNASRDRREGKAGGGQGGLSGGGSYIGGGEDSTVANGTASAACECRGCRNAPRRRSAGSAAFSVWLRGRHPATLPPFTRSVVANTTSFISDLIALTGRMRGAKSHQCTDSLQHPKTSTEVIYSNFQKGARRALPRARVRARRGAVRAQAPPPLTLYPMSTPSLPALLPSSTTGPRLGQYSLHPSVSLSLSPARARVPSEHSLPTPIFLTSIRWHHPPPSSTVNPIALHPPH